MNLAKARFETTTGTESRLVIRGRRAPSHREAVHDRRASDLTLNAQIAIVQVDDPYEPGAKITAIRSTRGDTLAFMHAKGDIDAAQFHAGRDLQGFYEAAEIGGVRGIDPSKEAVDGGGIRETLTESVQRAMGEIARLEKVLGKEGTALVRDVLILGLTIQKAATARGLLSDRGEKFLGVRFRECLETLARELNYISK